MLHSTSHFSHSQHVLQAWAHQTQTRKQSHRPVCQPNGAVQVQQGRDEVSLDFSLDDTGGDREDALVGMSFHVPREADNFEAEEEDSTSLKVCDAVSAEACQDSRNGEAQPDAEPVPYH